jgi:hypothetical protein
LIADVERKESIQFVGEKHYVSISVKNFCPVITSAVFSVIEEHAKRLIKLSLAGRFATKKEATASTSVLSCVIQVKNARTSHVRHKF